MVLQKADPGRELRANEFVAQDSSGDTTFTTTMLSIGQIISWIGFHDCLFTEKNVTVIKAKSTWKGMGIKSPWGVPLSHV